MHHWLLTPENGIRAFLTLDLLLVLGIWGHEMYVSGLDTDSFVFGFVKALAITLVLNAAVIGILSIVVMWATAH